MKVIFLDIDGVLNTRHTLERAGRFVGLDHMLVARFNSLLMLIGDAKVVLSCTWRLTPELRHAVAEQIPLYDDTDHQPGTRGQQIERWLAVHPEVTKHAVIDDDRDMVPGLVCFFTDNKWERGLTMEIVASVWQYMRD